MDAFETILSRRSIRHYTDQAVSKEMIEKILHGAMAAPTARNEQSWQFVVIDDRATLTAITQYHQFADMLNEAPLAIAVCGDIRKESHEEYWEQNCAAATQNILLTAHAHGLGTVWLGIYPNQKRVQKTIDLLKLPKGIIPMAVVAVGYPAEEKQPSKRYNIAKIHRNEWQG